MIWGVRRVHFVHINVWYVVAVVRFDLVWVFRVWFADHCCLMLLGLLLLLLWWKYLLHYYYY